MSYLGASLIFISSAVADGGCLIWKAFSEESQITQFVERVADISLPGLKGRDTRCAVVRVLLVRVHPLQSVSAPVCLMWLLPPVTAERRKERVRPVRNGKRVGNKKLPVSCV